MFLVRTFTALLLGSLGTLLLGMVGTSNLRNFATRNLRNLALAGNLFVVHLRSLAVGEPCSWEPGTFGEAGYLLLRSAPRPLLWLKTPKQGLLLGKHDLNNGLTFIYLESMTSGS